MSYLTDRARRALVPPVSDPPVGSVVMVAVATLSLVMMAQMVVGDRYGYPASGDSPFNGSAEWFVLSVAAISMILTGVYWRTPLRYAPLTLAVFGLAYFWVSLDVAKAAFALHSTRERGIGFPAAYHPSLLLTFGYMLLMIYAVVQVEALGRWLATRHARTNPKTLAPRGARRTRKKAR